MQQREEEVISRARTLHQDALRVGEEGHLEESRQLLVSANALKPEDPDIQRDLVRVRELVEARPLSLGQIFEEQARRLSGLLVVHRDRVSNGLILALGLLLVWIMAIAYRMASPRIRN